jgi:hypothetical protein
MEAERMMPLDPITLGMVLGLAGVAWWIAVGVRTTEARTWEVITIIALIIVGVAMFVSTVFLMLLKGGH